MYYKLLLILFITILHAPHAQAQERSRYRIEILVLTHLHSEAVAEEEPLAEETVPEPAANITEEEEMEPEPPINITTINTGIPIIYLKIPLISFKNG